MRPGPVMANSFPITWEAAERLVPGIREEWRQMNETPPNPSYRLGGMSEDDVYLEQDGECIWVVQKDPKGEWYFAPCWVRNPKGHWTSPLPLPQLLHDSLFLKRDETDTIKEPPICDPSITD